MTEEISGNAINNPMDPIVVEMPVEISYSEICGFWRRLFAFFIDNLILGIIGAFFGLFFFDYFASIGPWGRILGIVITLLYFGLLNSSLWGGQTLGNKITKIRVVNREGSTIPFGTSILRTFILYLPYYVNGMPLPIEYTLSPNILTILLTMVLFGLGGGIIYFYIFNRRTRQSIHDLICKTYVVKATSFGIVETQPVARLHYIILGTYTVVLILFITLVAPLIISNSFFAQIMPVVIKLNHQPNVRTASLFVNTTYSTNAGTYTDVVANVQIIENPTFPEDKELEYAKIILEDYPESQNKDYITIALNQVVDLGIFSSHKAIGARYSPTEWKNRIAAKSFH